MLRVISTTSTVDRPGERRLKDEELSGLSVSPDSILSDLFSVVYIAPGQLTGIMKEPHMLQVKVCTVIIALFSFCLFWGKI